jgi:hypothetical protein
MDPPLRSPLFEEKGRLGGSRRDEVKEKIDRF